MPATEQETTMTDTKAVEKALCELERVRDIVIHMPQPGNWDIVVNTLVEDIDKLIPSARSALAALLAERDKLRAALVAADKLLALCRPQLNDPDEPPPSSDPFIEAVNNYQAARAKASA
jgi:hypothetical protein